MVKITNNTSSDTRKFYKREEWVGRRKSHKIEWLLTKSGQNGTKTVRQKPTEMAVRWKTPC